jgi:hypothetical protein
VTVPDAIRCTSCEQSKPPDHFSRDATTPSGRDRHCKACRRERRRSSREQLRESGRKRTARWRANPANVLGVDAANAAVRQRRAANPTVERERNRLRYAANREAERERNRRWYQANRDVAMRRKTRRRVALLGVPSLPYTRAEVFAKTNGHCYSCGQFLDAGFVVDHIIPLQPRPGEPQGCDCPANVAPQCGVCSPRKSNRQPTDALFVELRARRLQDAFGEVGRGDESRTTLKALADAA